MTEWRLVAVHAHPDDESITMGGTLARSVRLGHRVTVVTCTLGEEGEIIPPQLAGLESAAADQLGGYRYTELRDACAALGVTDHRYLGGLGAFRDSGMVGTPSAEHPRAFVHAGRGGPRHAEAVASLRAVLDEIRPHVVLSYDADGGYGHPDHVTAHQVAVDAAVAAGVPRVLAVVRTEAAAVAAIEGLAVPPGMTRATPADLGYVADEAELVLDLDVSIDRAARTAALAAHPTQVIVIPGGFALSNLVAQPVFDTESYRLLAGAALPAGATELFDGLQP